MEHEKIYRHDPGRVEEIREVCELLSQNSSGGFIVSEGKHGISISKEILDNRPITLEVGTEIFIVSK